MADRPFIGKWISCLYRIEQAFFDRAFARYGIGSGHYACLLCLFRREGITQERISQRLHIDKATVARAISRLQALGYVERVVDPVDRRAYKVYLTATGRALQPEIRRVLQEWADLITADLAPGESDQAYLLLERMAKNAVSGKVRLGPQPK